MSRSKRFTIYDKMESDGVFDANPANTASRNPTTGESLYKGPVEFPKALFHPDGEEKITVPAEIIMTPMGPKAVGEQRELIFETAKNAAEEAALRAEGWHDHPAKAVRRRVELLIERNPEMTEKEKAKLLAVVPPISSESRIKELELELARLTRAATVEPAPEPKAEAKPVPAGSQSALQPLAAANALGANFGKAHSPAPATPT